MRKYKNNICTKSMQTLKIIYKSKIDSSYGKQNEEIIKFAYNETHDGIVYGTLVESQTNRKLALLEAGGK